MKDAENLSWSTRYRSPLFIDAGRREDHLSWLALDRMGIDFPCEVETKGIIGVVELVDCVRRHKSHAAMDDCYYWLLEDRRQRDVVGFVTRCHSA